MIFFLFINYIPHVAKNCSNICYIYNMRQQWHVGALVDGITYMYMSGLSVLVLYKVKLLSPLKGVHVPKKSVAYLFFVAVKNRMALIVVNS